MVSTFALQRVEAFSLSLFSVIRPLCWVLTVLSRVALNSSAVVLGDMKRMMMMTRTAVLRVVYVCLVVTGVLAGM